MKKILVTTLVASALAISAFAQGTVTFSASKGTIKYTVDGKQASAVAVPVGAPAQIPGYGNFNLALYAAPKGATLSLNGIAPDFTKNGWLKQESAILSSVAPFAGTIGNNVVTIPASLSGDAGGTPVQLTVVAWTGNFSSFEAALADGKQLLGWSGDPRFTAVGAASWQQATGTNGKDGNPPSAALLATGAAAFQGIVMAPIPEPSTFALAGLGAAALLIFRRRK